MKIVNLKSNNILRLEAVEISPKGKTVIIGGKNGQGKTSILDSISLAIGGRKTAHQEPLKRGADKGEIICDLGKIVVKKTYTKKGDYISVETKDGAKYPNPQSLLNDFFSLLTFDPLEWSRMDSKKQLAILKNLVGLDFGALNKERQELYEKRTEEKKEYEKLKAKFSSIPEIRDKLPEKKIIVSDLLEQLNKNKKQNLIRAALEDRIERGNDYIKEQEESIKELQERIRISRGEIAGLKDELSRTKLLPEKEIEEKIKTAESINEKIQLNESRETLKHDIEIQEKECNSLTNSIKAIDDKKEKEMQKVKFPIDGLGFDESGVTYNGIPFSQASSAEQLKISVSMGLAMNPQLKVLLIRDGSLLDDDSLRIVQEIASKIDGAQIWIERVGEGSECQVIIEDGKIKK